MKLCPTLNKRPIRCKKSINQVANAPTIHDKLYVVKREQCRNGNPLGFMTPYTNDAAFRKRRTTMLNWAYKERYYHSGNYSANDWWSYHQQRNNYYQPSPIFYIVSKDGNVVECFRWEKDETLPPITDIREKFKGYSGHDLPESVPAYRLDKLADDETYAPQILDNAPQENFQFTREVRRTYWGGGNVVWRVLDPRGFELEISSSNLAKIIDCSTISEGIIKDACVWGRMGKDNVLIPVSSEVYKNAMQKMQNIATSKTMTLKDVVPGDIIQILNDETHYEYFGSYHVMLNKDITVDNGSNRRYDVGGKIVTRYVLRKNNTDEYVFAPSVKLQKIITKIDTPKLKSDVAVMLNEVVRKGSINSENIIMVSAEIVKSRKLYLREVPDESLAKNNTPKGKFRYSESIFYPRFYYDSEGNTNLICEVGSKSFVMQSIKITIQNDSEVRLNMKSNVEPGNIWQPTRTVYSMKYNIEKPDIETKLYEMVLVVNDKNKQPIAYLGGNYYR